jgi:hypothetical protein
MSPRRLRAIARRLESLERDYEMWLDEDETELIAISLQPLMIDPATRGYLQHVSWQMRRALQHLETLVDEHDAMAELIPRSDAEQRWFERFGGPGAARGGLFCRLDALFQPGRPGQPSELQFIEPNIVGIGGLALTDDTASAVAEHVVRPILDDTLEHVATTGDDPRALLRGEFRDFARRLGLPDAPVVAFVDEREELDEDGEERRLLEWFRESDMAVVFSDPRALSLADDGTIVADGCAVDMLYRRIELQDLIELERDGADLDALREAFERNVVMPPLAGDLDHKTVFEIFTRRSFRPFFTEAQRRVFDQHVLWTRLLNERRTHTHHGENVDLPTWVRDHRRELVVKPNRSYGGHDVLLGADTDQGTWNDAIDAALESPDQFVVQRAAPLVRRSVALVESGTLETYPAYSVIGAFPSTHGLGLLGFSGDNIVNITRGGGLVPVLTDFS